MRRALLAFVLLPFSSPVARSEPGDEAWEEATESPPAWVVSPPPRDGWVRVVDAGQSNVRDLALSVDPGQMTQREVAEEVTWRLRPVLGKDARAAADAIETVALVRKAFHLHPPREGAKPTPGGAHFTVWALWETSIDPILIAVPAAKREAARAALERRAPPAEPKWEPVAEPPAFQGLGASLRVPVKTTSDHQEIARADAMALGRSHVGNALMLRLRELLGAAEAWRVAREGTSWRSLVRRGSGLEPKKPDLGQHALAWTLWDVPLEPLLAAVPAAKRADARARLVAPETK